MFCKCLLHCSSERPLATKTPNLVLSLFREKKHDLVFMKIAENHIMFFFSLLKPDHGFDICRKKA